MKNHSKFFFFLEAPTYYYKPYGGTCRGEKGEREGGRKGEREREDEHETAHSLIKRFGPWLI